MSDGSAIDPIQGALASIGVDIPTILDDVATTELGDIINGYKAKVRPVRQNLPSGYLTWADYTSSQFTFLYPGYFDINLGLFAGHTKQPVTLGELLIIPSVPNTTSFGGPVQVVNGRHDAIFCGGDCLASGITGLSIPSMAKASFPKASSFQAYLQPNTGHGLNLHYNSTGTYRVIQEWLFAHGLAVQ